MLDAGSPERPTTKASGRLSQVLMRLLMRRATIAAAEPLPGRFHLITLEGEGLRDIAWTPGQKVQVAMGSAFVARTYTPMTWNADAGRTCILGYAHGSGPGSDWIRTVRPGDECDLFSPRKSLDISLITAPLMVFGDETSLALAYALAQPDPDRAVTCHFEVADARATQEVLQQLGLVSAYLYPRAHDDRHLAELEAAISRQLAGDPVFVLTGRAAAVQRLHRHLRLAGVAAARIHTKAYWAPGKTGMD
ncbi:siderophore-interacting protein [Sphingomonas sp. AP4-R1]|uniref:siderophore-interacting protein n=1 Tax=Sphingomonas sp. AP4-R1 TaxID=2735134 RepID=UPI001493B95C|nr:siderophore-interacting protein [Sphingomonas sp. AP4-R1]QJU59288.1 siderophore-interacting protein [Sphingomonas sp. AP4-R1]